MKPLFSRRWIDVCLIAGLLSASTVQAGFDEGGFEDTSSALSHLQPLGIPELVIGETSIKIGQTDTSVEGFDWVLQDYNKHEDFDTYPSSFYPFDSVDFCSHGKDPCF